MVICKFFLQGNCRYGTSCKFEHSYNTKYSYHATKNNPPQHQQTQPQAAGLTDEQLVNQVRADILSALKGNQWLLSSCAPYKDKPALPGFTDLSPEEARLFFYEAKSTNNLEQAVAYMNNLYKEARQKYEQYLQPNTAIINTLRSIHKGEPVTSPFAQSSSNTSSSVFRIAGQSAPAFGQNLSSGNAGSIFAQANQNIFGQTNKNTNTAASIFGQANQKTSVFGQPNQSSNAASLFGQANQSMQTNQAASIFGQANQATNAAASFFGQAQNAFPTSPTSNSVFAQASPNAFGSQSPFGQSSEATSIFAQANQNIPQASQNVFQINQQPSNVFPNTSPFAKPSVPTTQQLDAYSKVEELTETDIEAFKCSDFKLGFVPELPPPQELCA